LNTSLPDPARFTHLTATLAGQVHQEIAPHVPLDQVTEWAMAALHRGVIQYRSRQGASLRTYLTYKILDGIYNALSETAWPSVHDENRYKFAKKSNEL